MAKSTKPSPDDYIVPLDMNGLEGRMLHMPAPPKKPGREILFVYGHHSSLERWWGVMLNLNRYGAVTMPDLPGFGGMDSFYTIDKDASLDNYADYLAAFIKLRYKRKRVTLVGMSLGFVMVTRMLQRYPELTDRVDMLVSFAGFAHTDDFSFSRTRRRFYSLVSGILSHRGPALFFRYVCLRPSFIKAAYKHSHNEKVEGFDAEETEAIANFEVQLWHQNDVRTQMRTTHEFLSLDNCNVKVDMPVNHVALAADRYFDNNSVEQHLRIIFSDYKLLTTLHIDGHAPSVIADAKAAAPFVPPKLRRMLNQL